jgi:hypothetical protein
MEPAVVLEGIAVGESQLRISVIRVDRSFSVRHVDHAHADSGNQKQRHEDDDKGDAFFLTATVARIPKIAFAHNGRSPP